MNKGSCLCGDISWVIHNPPTMMSNCHCSMCRKAHGSAFATYIGASADFFTWISGEDRIGYYESSPDAFRPFCPRCGSVVAALMPDGKSAVMPAGNLEGQIEKTLESHMFVGSKAPWYEITDGVQQFVAYPDGYDIPAMETRERRPRTDGAIGGSCLCGDVAFEFDETLGRMGYCHCSRCRKSRSAAHSVQTFVALDKFRWLQGEDNLGSFKLPESELFTTTFCRTCGSIMPTVFEERSVVMVPAGTLDQDPGVRPQAHIFVGSKAPWFEITDDLPQFEAQPDI